MERYQSAVQNNGSPPPRRGGTDEYPDLPHPLQAPGEDSRWDEDNPGNWSAIILWQKIEARGLKLPSSMKKAHMLNISLDNFYEGPAVPATTTSGSVQPQRKATGRYCFGFTAVGQCNGEPDAGVS